MKKILLFLLAAVLLLQFCCASAESFPVLSVGDNGPEVLEVKERLRELRYITEKQLTKKYTEKTAESVRLFQRENGLPETGIVDEATAGVLFSDAAVMKPYETLVPLATPAPTSVPDWPGRDAEGFLAGDGEYCSASGSGCPGICRSSSLPGRIPPSRWSGTKRISGRGEAKPSIP